MAAFRLSVRRAWHAKPYVAIRVLDRKRGETGTPIFDECRMRMDCRFRVAHGMGTFVLLIGEIMRTGKGAFYHRPTLIYRKECCYG